MAGNTNNLGMAKQYSDSFKRQAVATLISRGYPGERVARPTAREYGVSVNTLKDWYLQHVDSEIKQQQTKVNESEADRIAIPADPLAHIVAMLETDLEAALTIIPSKLDESSLQTIVNCVAVLTDKLAQLTGRQASRERHDVIVAIKNTVAPWSAPDDYIDAEP